MNVLVKKLKKYNFEDILKIEELDRQFIAIKKLYNNINDKNIFLLLILSNALICYQLSGKGEAYWEEFSKYFSEIELNKNTLLDDLAQFIKSSKNNKRFINIKIKRLNKLRGFINIFLGKEEYFYKNMSELRDILAKVMKQKKDAKTIVFAIKIFGYGARNIYEFVEYPKEIFIPIDSRLTNLYNKFNDDKNLTIEYFYKNISVDLNISMLHLDSLLWSKYEELII